MSNNHSTTFYTTYSVRMNPDSGLLPHERRFSILCKSQSIGERTRLASEIGRDIACEEGREYFETQAL